MRGWAGEMESEHAFDCSANSEIRCNIQEQKFAKIINMGRMQIRMMQI